MRAKFQGEFLDSSVDFDVDRLALPCSRPHGLIVSDDITGRLAVSAAPQLVSGVVSWGWCEAHGKPIQLGWQDEGWGDWDPEDNPAVSQGFTSRSTYQAVCANGGGALLGNSIPLAAECCCDEDCRSSLMERFCTELSRVEHAVGGSGKRRKTVSFAEPPPLPEPSMSVTGVRPSLAERWREAVPDIIVGEAAHSWEMRGHPWAAARSALGATPAESLVGKLRNEQPTRRASAGGRR